MSDNLTKLLSTVEELRTQHMSDLNTIYQLVNEIKQSHIKKLPEHFQRIGYLRYLATDPKTIIYVGVQGGTPNLYEAFDHLPFVLVDPQRDSESILNA